MKCNKFFFALALCCSISSSINFAQQANGWGSSATTVYNTIKSHGNKIFDAGSGFMTNISTPIFNIMSSWNTDKIFSVVKVGLAILIGIFGIKKVAELTMNFFIKKILHLAETNLSYALPSSINDLQEAAALISPKERENLNQKLFDKYYNDYKQYIENITNNYPNAINPLVDVIDPLRIEVIDLNYIFKNKNSVIRHNIIQNTINKSYITAEEMPKYYIGKSINEIPGLNWGEDGLRYKALKNLQMEEEHKQNRNQSNLLMLKQ